MTIEVHQAELETLIKERMATGRFENVEEVLLDALRLSQLAVPTPSAVPVSRKSFYDFIRESPLVGSGIEFERSEDPPRQVDL